MLFKHILRFRNIILKRETTKIAQHPLATSFDRQGVYVSLAKIRLVIDYIAYKDSK